MLRVTCGARSSAWLPLLTALTGVGIVTLSSTAPTLATTLGLAVGMRDGMELTESLGWAVEGIAAFVQKRRPALSHDRRGLSPRREDRGGRK